MRLAETRFAYIESDGPLDGPEPLHGKIICKLALYQQSRH